MAKKNPKTKKFNKLEKERGRKMRRVIFCESRVAIWPFKRSTLAFLNCLPQMKWYGHLAILWLFCFECYVKYYILRTISSKTGQNLQHFKKYSFLFQLFLRISLKIRP